MASRNYGAVRDADTVVCLTKKLITEGKPFAFDIEAGYRGEDKKDVSLMQFHPDYFVVGISFTNSSEWARYVPFAHDNGGNVDDLVVTARALWRLLNTGRGVAHNCFSGDTTILTRSGVRTLAELAGSSAEIWTKRGWVTAPIQQYPAAELFEVELVPFGRSQSTVCHKVRATANHRWITAKASRATGSPESSWDQELRTTLELIPGMALPAMVVDVVPDLYSDGFRHGLIFADGARSSRSRKRGTLAYQIRLCGAKEQYKDRFPKYTYPESSGGDPVVNHYVSPNEMDLKELPPEGTGSQYLADFIAGWTAGDGSHNQNGSGVLCTTRLDSVRWLERNSALAGVVVTGVSSSERTSGYGRKDGSSQTSYVVTIAGGPMAWRVKSVTSTGVSEVVYCPAVPEQEEFTLAPGIYTKNCAYELKGMSRWFRETLWDDPELGEEIRASRGFFPFLADTMALVYLTACYHPLRIGKDLKSVSLEAFGMTMTKFEDLFITTESDLGPGTKAKKGYQRFNTRNSYSTKIIEYACEDSVASLMIYEKFIKDLETTKVYRIEKALTPVLIDMEAGLLDEHGVFSGNMHFDWPMVQRKDDEAKEFTALMGEEIQEELGRRLGKTLNLNLNSTKQLAEVLFTAKPEGLGLPVNERLRSEKTGAPSTSDEALQSIAKSDPVIRQILEYRQLIKLRSSYLTKFLSEFRYSGTGYVFPNHNQYGALTGRLSVDQVSYQQWPKPYHFALLSGKEFDLNFRDLFTAPDEYRILGFDYANVEMRVAGAMSGEPKIINAFNHGMDLHKSTAAATFKVAFEDVTKKQRQAAKTLNFAILYGSGDSNISEMLTSPESPVTKEDAAKMLADYLQGYPVLANWIDGLKATGRQQKFVSTHFGRKFTLWDLFEREDWKRGKADRLAVNAPVQGTAADIMKLAMGRVQKEIKAAGLQKLVRLTLTIHDALEFLVHESVSTQTVIDLVEPCVNFHVPGFPLEIRADWHEGYQWGAMADIKLDQDKRVSGYGMEYELPWAKQAFEWEGDTLHAVLDQYYTWEWEKFGVSATYYAKRNPDFVLPTSKEVPEKVQGASEDSEDEDPGWFHSAEWHEAHDNPQTATVTLVDMPTHETWKTFTDYLEQHPGFNKVVVETPEGPITLDTLHLLTPEDQPQISLILGGAGLVIASDFVDTDAVLEGVVL